MRVRFPHLQHLRLTFYPPSRPSADDFLDIPGLVALDFFIIAKKPMAFK
jgi:hypothetical protein